MEKIKILQFGEGNFLRAFVDYAVHKANKDGIYDGKVAIAKSIEFGTLEKFLEQQNKYHVVLKGRLGGKVYDEGEEITSISNVFGCYEDYGTFMSYAKSADLEVIVSNTTEAGIALSEEDSFEAEPPKSYPAKLTKFLYERFTAFSGDKEKGLYILPCELIENNGKKLFECVVKTAEKWKLPTEFTSWVEDNCFFCVTLVDRIVTGFSKEESEKYSDKLVDVCEPFFFWAIENKGDISKILPLDKTGLNVVFTDNVAAYRERKVRILNGAHTSTILGAYLAGYEIVRDIMADKIISGFIKKCVIDEIIPTLPLSTEESMAFADSVFERFDNPFIDHKLLDISLNSVSKWKARILGSLKDSFNKNGILPNALTFSFAALLAFYMGGDGYEVKDSADIVAFFKESSKLPIGEYVSLTAKNTDLWGEDLSLIPGFCQKVEGYLVDILTIGAKTAMEKIVNGEN